MQAYIDKPAIGLERFAFRIGDYRAGAVERSVFTEKTVSHHAIQSVRCAAQFRGKGAALGRPENKITAIMEHRMGAFRFIVYVISGDEGGQ